ncbi:MAG: hypothetical protein Q4A32_02480 [Lachnospiraceae bacterium]|nr:hypothetical protein [Lachnospiraceae bacterium]
MKKIRAGLFFLATVVFVGLLCYAVFNALAIYIPQRREIRKFEKLKESVRALSMVHLPDAPTYPAQIMFLSTCSYHTEDGRFVVAAYRVE